MTAMLQPHPKIPQKIDSPFPHILFSFTLYLLQSALKQGISRFYFLSRDGYLLHRTAKIISAKQNLNLDLRYLYCSRIALRTAALSDLGEEAYKYLLEGGYSLTPKVILGRLKLDEEQRNKVYADIGFSGDENEILPKPSASDFCNKLRNSEVYNSYIKSVSESSKAATLAYLEQEGLMSDVPYAIVDSGWTGSMQRMLRILTGKKQTGFYFGMYTEGSSEDGEFNTFLFDKSTSPLLVSKFNNNLFETICSAPHGMTEGYKFEGAKAVPILKEGKSLNYGNELLQEIEQQIYSYAENETFFPSKETTLKERQKLYFPLLDKLMYKPDIETAKLYGSLRFSDDTAELNSFPLAERLEDTKGLYFLPRLLKKLFKKEKTASPLFWSYGTAVLSGKGRFCRLNLRLWEILWLIKRK